MTCLFTDVTSTLTVFVYRFLGMQPTRLWEILSRGLNGSQKKRSSFGFLHSLQTLGSSDSTAFFLVCLCTWEFRLGVLAAWAWHALVEEFGIRDASGLRRCSFLRFFFAEADSYNYPTRSLNFLSSMFFFVSI